MGASAYPQLPVTTVVTPKSERGVTSGSQKRLASRCVCGSMNPGATEPRPSSSSASRPVCPLPGDPVAVDARRPRTRDHRCRRRRPRPVPRGRAAPSSSGDGSNTPVVRRTLPEHAGTPLRVQVGRHARGDVGGLLVPRSRQAEPELSPSRSCTRATRSARGSYGTALPGAEGARVARCGEVVGVGLPGEAVESWKYGAVGKPLWSAPWAHHPDNIGDGKHPPGLHRDATSIESVDGADGVGEVGPREDLERQRLVLQRCQRRPRVPPGAEGEGRDGRSPPPTDRHRSLRDRVAPGTGFSRCASSGPV